MVLPGPPELGRGVVVGDGPVPGPWVDAPVVVVDEAVLAAPAAVVGELHRAWAARLPVAVRLSVDPARFRIPRDHDVEPWTLPADFEVWEDRLQFLVWANNYDARSDGEPVWWWARKALRLGARPIDPQAQPDVEGDVLLPDGRAAWIDGGPRGPLDAAAGVVVHRESVERDRLTVVAPASEPAADLAADQRAAVAHPAGPARVIAPAGSGKTRVLTERLRHLLVDRGWERDAVVAVAYNKKAQEELDARTRAFGPQTRTLNSLGLSLIARARGRSPEVLDERDVRRMVEHLAPARRRRSNTDPIGPYLEALGQVRLGLRAPEEVEASRDDVPGLAELWPGFRRDLRARQAVDFDEQIYGAVEVLLADGAFRARAQLGCRHLLVDEFQDLTPAHVLMLRLLASPVLDCFGVGDDDQVIYGHAGADPGFLIGYGRLFPDGADHPLEVNYRCPPAVVGAASSLLSYNHRRVDKVIRAGRTAADGDGSGLEVHLHPAGAGAADLVATVGGWVADGSAPASVAVLTRVNSLLLAPHLALVDAGLPVASVVRPELLERTGLRAALAYLRIATAPEAGIDGRDVVEILRRPSRGLPPWFSDRLRRRGAWSLGQIRGIAATVPAKDATNVERLVDELAALREAAGSGTDAAGLLRLVRDEVGLGRAMTLLDGGSGGESSSHIDDLEALEQVAGLHPDPSGLEGWVRDRLARPADPAGITLSTVHRVKGMEWDHVAVYGVSAGILPHRLADDDEEERRVLHVAITRGRRRVAVLVDGSRPSPFVDELAGTAEHRPAGAARPSAAAGAGPGRERRRPGPAGTGEEGDPAVAEALREWRRRRAGSDGVPAYVVFADRTLRAIAARRPVTLVDLRAVEGIGPTKLELYGEDILAVVAAAAPATEPAPQG